MSPADWGYACEDFEMLECLRRMARDIERWDECSMANALELDRGARWDMRGLCIYDPRFTETRYNCFVDLEVEMALWPKYTWNVGFHA